LANTSEVPKKWRKSKNTIFIGDTVTLDLKKTEEELLSEMGKYTRKNIRWSEKKVTVQSPNASELPFDELYALYKSTSERAGFGIHSPDYYQNLLNAPSDFNKVYIAYAKDEEENEVPVSLLWNITNQNLAFELYGGMNELGQKMRANYILKWTAILDSKKCGAKTYDMNGLVSDGVNQFKLGFIGNDLTKTTHYIGTLDYPLSPYYWIWENLLPFAKSVLRKFRTK
jgi:lipid II:glycine glycyltransferase (peptidoglycan interpeptide bridge formation enzyme)